MSKYLPIGNRLMDTAYLRDGNVEHTGEALLLALILHTKGKTKRSKQELEEIGKLFNDPNVTTKTNRR